MSLGRILLVQLAYYDNVAPRHDGMLNVLYVDGRVETTTPQAVDPTDPLVHDSKWCPDIDMRNTWHVLLV